MTSDIFTEPEPTGPTCPKCGSTFFQAVYIQPTMQFDGYDCLDCGYAVDRDGAEINDDPPATDSEPTPTPLPQQENSA